MKLTDLRDILHYIPQFREKIFILAIDGDIVTGDNFATLLLDVALLWSLNIRIVLVHGAAAQIRALAEEQRVKASDFDGTGVTDAATLSLALAAANRMSEASQAFGGAVAARPDDIRLLNLWGRTLGAEARYLDAVVPMRRVVELAPTDTQARDNLRIIEKLAAQQAASGARATVALP